MSIKVFDIAELVLNNSDPWEIRVFWFFFSRKNINMNLIIFWTKNFLKKKIFFFFTLNFLLYYFSFNSCFLHITIPFIISYHISPNLSERADPARIKTRLFKFELTQIELDRITFLKI